MKSDNFMLSRRGLLSKLRDLYGAKNQLVVGAEECCELSKELLKAIRYDNTDRAIIETREAVLEEYVDVSIMLEHIRSIYGFTDIEIDSVENKKFNRIAKWVQTDSDSIETTLNIRG